MAGIWDKDLPMLTLTPDASPMMGGYLLRCLGAVLQANISPATRCDSRLC